MITPQIQHSTRTSSTQHAVGVLLVHGLNGNTGDMAELEDILRKQSIITKNMLLPGHGSKVKDMLSIGWDEWAQAVHDELSQLKELCDVVFLVGHSLGGALVLHVAAHEDVAGVVPICAPLHLHLWLKPAVSICKYLLPREPTLRVDVSDADARHRYIRDVDLW